MTVTDDRGNKKARRRPRFFLKSDADRDLLADGGGLRALGLLDDAGRLAAQIAQVIEFRAAHLAAAHHLDRIDHRRHHREDAFHAFAVGNLAHRKALVEACAGAADADAFIGLHARAVAFDHLDVDDHGIAGSEIRNLLAGGQFVELLFFALLNEVHWKSPSAARPAERAALYPAICCGIGARIRQSLALVTHLSCFFGRFWRSVFAAQRSG